VENASRVVHGYCLHRLDVRYAAYIQLLDVQMGSGAELLFMGSLSNNSLLSAMHLWPLNKHV